MWVICSSSKVVVLWAPTETVEIATAIAAAANVTKAFFMPSSSCG